MIRHLISLLWNRKRHNFLVAVEIFCSFLVLFAVTFATVTYVHNWRQPLGYDIDRVWNINVLRTGAPRGPEGSRITFEQMVAALKEMPQIEAAAGANTAPYVNSSWGTSDELAEGRHVSYSMNGVTDDFNNAVALRLLHGRWFSREDDGDVLRAVVINRRLAREYFGREDVAGQIVRVKRIANEHPLEPREDKRIVGVVEDFRTHGEFSAPDNFLFHRLRLDGGGKPLPGFQTQLPSVLVIRVVPGTTAAFEETLVRRLQAASGGWAFDVKPAVDMRRDMLQQYATPLLAIGTIAVFLLLMVALGLTGVVWQSVTQRTREFGLRRAKGATIANIRRQVLGELAVLATVALFAAFVLISQLPFLPIDPRNVFVSAGGVMITGIKGGYGVLLASVALSAAAIYLLTLVCGWYPSRLATRIQPADALHYE